MSSPASVLERPAAASIGYFNDVRHAIIAVVAAFSTFNPSWVTQHGATIVLVCCLPDIRKFRPHSADVWAVLFVALMSASQRWTQSPSLTRAAVADQVAVTLLFIALRIAITSRRALGFVALGYFIGCLWSMRLVLRVNPTAYLSLRFDASNVFTIHGVNANYLAYALAGGIAVTVILGMIVERGRWLVMPTSIAAAYAGIGLTGARGAFIAAVAAIVWLLVPTRLRRVGLVVIYCVVVIIALGIFTGFTDEIMRSYIPHRKWSVGRSERPIALVAGCKGSI